MLTTILFTELKKGYFMRLTEAHFSAATRILAWFSKVNPGAVWSSETMSTVTRVLGHRHLRYLIEHSDRGRLTRKTLYAVANNLVCLHCDNYLLDGRAGSCSSSLCSRCNADPVVDKTFYKVARTKSTNLARYGVENVYQADEIKAKIRKISLERYGAPNPASKESSRYIAKQPAHLVEKRKLAQRESSVDRYGTGLHHWTQVPELKERRIKELQRQHGPSVTNVMHIPKVRKKHRAVMQQLKEDGVFKDLYATKIVPYMLANYGVANQFERAEYIKQARIRKTGYEFSLQDPAALENFRATCRKRYGADHFMQNKTVYKRIASTRSTLHLYEVSYRKRTYCLIGSYEVFVLRVLLARYRSTDVRSSFDLHPLENYTGQRYYPDFHLRSVDKYLEVKSIYTLFGKDNVFLELNKDKARWFEGEGIDLTFVVPDPKRGTVCQLPKTWFNWKPERILAYVKSNQRDVQGVPEDQVQVRLVHKFGQVESS